MHDHDPTLNEKTSTRYFTDDEVEVPPMPLYRYSCSCGWECGVWYADADRAIRTFERHLTVKAAA